MQELYTSPYLQLDMGLIIISCKTCITALTDRTEPWTSLRRDQKGEGKENLFMCLNLALLQAALKMVRLFLMKFCCGYLSRSRVSQFAFGYKFCISDEQV